MQDRQRELEKLLSSFNADERRGALEDLAALDDTEMVARATRGPNMHLHSFFSCSAWGYSPSQIVYEAKKQGMSVAGIVDFDNLDGLDEAYAAGDLLGQPVVFGLESRVLVPSWHDIEVNSPGERGVAYFMLHGIARKPEGHDHGIGTLGSMRRASQIRYRQVIELLNDVLKPVALSYESVKKLTPGGSPTERHIATASAKMIVGAMGAGPAGQTYVQKLFGVEQADAYMLLVDEKALADRIRAMTKVGGPAYLPPTAEIFPDVKTVIGFGIDLGGIACGAWLDGVTLSGERAVCALVEAYREMGCGAMNVITPRSTSDRDLEIQIAKGEALATMCERAVKLDMLLSFGTEGNGPGQPFLDDYGVPGLSPYRVMAENGAYALYGHTLMQRALRWGMDSEWARRHFADRALANSFYTTLGEAAHDPARSLEVIVEHQADGPIQIYQSVVAANRD